MVGKWLNYRYYIALSSTASSLLMVTIPFLSATMISPGFIVNPPQLIGSLIAPTLSLVPDWGHMPLAKNGSCVTYSRSSQHGEALTYFCVAALSR